MAVAPPPQQQIDPTYLSALFPGGIPGGDTSALTQRILAMLMPQFAQQDQAETEALANAGIVGGSTSGAMGALGEQQQTTAMGEMVPYLMQGLQMQLGAGEFDANTANQFLSQIMGFKNQDWLAEMGAASGINQEGEQGQTQAYQPIYSQPENVGSGFGGLGAALSPGAGGSGYGGLSAPPGGWGYNPDGSSIIPIQGGF